MIVWGILYILAHLNPMIHFECGFIKGLKFIEPKKLVRNSNFFCLLRASCVKLSICHILLSRHGYFASHVTIIQIYK